MYIVYLPLLCESPLVSFFSAIRMYATCAVFSSHGIFGLAPSVGHGGHVQRLSPPEPSAASIAAITRSGFAPCGFMNASTAFRPTEPRRRVLPLLHSKTS